MLARMVLPSTVRVPKLAMPAPSRNFAVTMFPETKESNTSSVPLLQMPAPAVPEFPDTSLALSVNTPVL